MIDEKYINAELINGTAVSGNVKVTMIKNGERIRSVTAHNTGTIYLCEYIAGALIGDYVIAKRPGAIMPFTKDGSGNRRWITPKPFGDDTYNKIGIDSSYWDGYEDEDGNTDGGFCTANMSFLLPSNQIAGAQIDGFMLLSVDEAHSTCAVVDLEESLFPSGDVNLKVDWTLYVSYKPEIDREG